MTNPIYYCLWFDSQAEEAARFYASLFSDSHVGHISYYGEVGIEHHGRPVGSVMTAEFTLAGQEFIALNGGPIFTINPSISFYVVCETADEVNKLWTELAKDGRIMMELDKYPWSELYGWLQDRYGVTWQIGLGKLVDVGQKITPSFLFVNKGDAKTEEAIKLYTSVFNNSGIKYVLKYEKGEHDIEGTVKHAQFSLLGKQFMAMDSSLAHEFSFNEGVSICVNCETQKEIDHYWEKFTANGGEESYCGWLKDKFGVSWQIVPVELIRMLKDTDKAKVDRVTNAFLKMRKFDIETLKKAFEGV